jgi:hypothetical protein
MFSRQQSKNQASISKQITQPLLPISSISSQLKLPKDRSLVKALNLIEIKRLLRIQKKDRSKKKGALLCHSSRILKT